MTTQLQQLKSRGLIHDASHFEELEKLLQSGSQTFYCGFDPTADSLHVGSMLPLVVMRRLQKWGHKPLVVLGSATGLIGDPSGKTEERKLLTEEVIQANMQGIEKQVRLFLSSEGDQAYQILKNDTWISPLSCIDFLRDIGKHFSVNAMMTKDSVRNRLENREHGISYTEFSYMLLQAFDFYYLFKHHHCKLQLGGSDQWGNITAGIELIRRMVQSGTGPGGYGLTFPLLTTASGAKFGKTEAGNVWLDAKRTSPYRFYQYWVNAEDRDVLNYIRFFTDIDGPELGELEKAVTEKPETRTAQQTLAYTLTELIHGREEAKRSVKASKVLFGEKIKDIDEKTLIDIFSDVPSTAISRTQLSTGIPVLELLILTGICQSKGEAKRLIEGGGFYINNERVNDQTLMVSSEHLATESICVLRSGKKAYHLVRIEK